MHIETGRLIIRDLLSDDWRLIELLISDPEVTRFQDFSWAGVDLSKPNEDEARRFVDGCIFHNEQQPRRAHNCAIVLRHTAEPIGWIGFGESDKTDIGDLSFGYALLRDQWNKGYMTEALVATLRFCFTETGADSVFGECVPANTASARVMEKAGMTYLSMFEMEQVAPRKRFIAYRAEWDRVKIRK